MKQARFFEGGSLPDSVPLDDVREIRFVTDFRAWLKYEYFLGQESEPQVRLGNCVEAVIKESPLSTSPAELWLAMQWFYSFGEIERTAELDLPENIRAAAAKQPVLFSLYWDFKALWDSFRQQYGLDLYACGAIHWWDFKRLERGLKEDTPYSRLRHLRGLKRADFTDHEGKLKGKARDEWDAVKIEQLCQAIPGQAERSFGSEWED